MLEHIYAILAYALDLVKIGKWVGCWVSIDTKHILAWVKENNPKA